MTAVAQFWCIPAAPRQFRTIEEAGQQPVTMMAEKLAGSCCGQAGGALRETTQSRNHDPTAQKQR
jgi:hypothetical protein